MPYTDQEARPILDRLIARTEYPDGEDGCWVSTLSPSQRYASIGLSGARRLVHVLAHEILNPDDPTTPERPMVLHWCGNGRCWRPGHLRAGNQTENMADAKRHGTQGPGEANRQAKLTWSIVQTIRERYAAGGITQRALGAEYGVHHAHVSAIVSGRFWKESA